MSERIDITGLWPDFSSIWPFPDLEDLSAEYLSLFFIVVMLLICLVFLSLAVISSCKASSRIKKLGKLLDSDTNVVIAKNSKGPAGHLWSEFEETLIEVRSNDARNEVSIVRYNSIDASHFFNTSTLASELTENRLLAAVPGFLTGIGVLGTFIGLQLGLSELNIGNDVAVEEMKTGLAQVISGAKIAFLTSVWGVLLSLFFNFCEKSLERSARNKIRKIQNRVDAKYPRLTPERQLQQIADHNAEMRESLQHLGEKIGDRLQTAIGELGDRIAEPLGGLVTDTEDANKNVLSTLIQEFLDQFKELGGDQAEKMRKANEGFSTAINSLDSSIALLLKQLEENQNNGAQREKELMQNLSDKVDSLVEKSTEQHKMLADIVGKTMSNIVASEGVRAEGTTAMLKRLESAMDNQLEASAKLIKQGEKLQQGLDSSVQGNNEVSTKLKESAIELEKVSQHMKGTGVSIENAGSKLSNSISKASDSTSLLAEKNQEVHGLLSTHQKLLTDQQQKLNESVEKINSLFATAQSSFDVMDEQQKEFLTGLNNHVNDLTKAISENFDSYSAGLNSATASQLEAYSKKTTEYAVSMNGAIRALGNVVDEIDGKLSVN